MAVHWLDAASQDAWHDPKSESGASTQECITVGVLLKADRSGIVVTHTVGIANGADGESCCSIAIPVGCIINMYQVKDVHEHLVRPRGKVAK